MKKGKSSLLTERKKKRNPIQYKIYPLFIRPPREKLASKYQKPCKNLLIFYIFNERVEKDIGKKKKKTRGRWDKWER